MFTAERFTHLAEQYKDMIFRLAFGYLKSPADADDVTQNVLLSLYRTDKAFESDAHIKNWLIRVTVNECKQVLRSPWRKTGDIAEYENTLAFEDSYSSGLFDAIMALDEKYRAVIVLYYYEGYSIAETARLLGLPPATAGTRLRRARLALRDYLTEAESYD